MSLTPPQMHRFTEKPAGWTTRVPGVSEGGQILSTAAIPPSAITNFYAGITDTSRCITCGVPSCSTGITTPISDLIVGCPFSHDIPDIQKEMEAAQAEFNKAFKILLRKNRDKAAEITRLQNNKDNPDLAKVRASVPDMVFKALKEEGLETTAKKYAEAYERHMRKAWDLSEAKGPMHDLYGRLCSDSLCKSSCVPEQAGHGAVEIPTNMTVLADYAAVKGWLDEPIVPQEQREETILIIGAGFAGLTAADQALRLGYKVVVVDKNKEPGEPGGQNILQYKILHERTRRHVKRYKNSGAEFVTNTKIGENGNTPDALAKQYNARAIIYTTGATVPNTLKLDGDAAGDVLTWSDVLSHQQEIDNDNSRTKIDPKTHTRGKVIAGIGTSDTAVDLLHTAALQGVTEVILISRGDHFSAKDVPALKKAEKTAEEYGVKFTVQKWMAPNAVNYNEAGRKILSGADKQNNGQTISLTVDEVVFAVSSNAGDLKTIFSNQDLPVNDRGFFAPLIPTPPNITGRRAGSDKVGSGYLGSNANGVFMLSAGDSTRGPSLAAQAGADGQNAVNFLHEQLLREKQAADSAFSDLLATQDLSKVSGRLHGLERG